MPRLSTELWEQRRRHVLVSAWQCFTRDGFHATSMDDIIAATGMSSSAVYRYFRSKSELVDATAEESLKRIRDLLAGLLAQEPAPSLAEVVEALVDYVAKHNKDEDYDLSKIAVYAWAEALRRPEVRTRTHDFYAGVRAQLTQLAQRWRDDGRLAPGADPDAVGAVLLTMLPGLIVTQHLVDGASATQLVDGLASLPSVR
ncbi:TetR/AcrR family transcriptional regulator [Kribbella sp. NPDC055071]